MYILNSISINIFILTSETLTISPDIFLTLLTFFKKYQNLLLAITGFGANNLILKRRGLASFSDGSLRPTT